MTNHYILWYHLFMSFEKEEDGRSAPPLSNPDNPATSGQNDEDALPSLPPPNRKRSMGGENFSSGKILPKKGNPRMKEEEKKVQAVAALARRTLLNETMEEIAQHFQMNRHAVASRLQLARTMDLTQLARDLIVERLVPKAIAVVDHHLNEGSYEAAKDVLFGTGGLQKSSKSEVHHSTTPTLDAIRAERANKAIEVKSSKIEDDDTTTS